MILIIAFLALWEVGAGRWLESWMVSSPSQIGFRLWQLFSSGEIWPHLEATLSSLTVGFPLGVIGGISIGCLLGTHPKTGLLLEPLIVALHGIPKVVLAPLFILWFGIGLASKIALVALLSFFQNFFSTYSGIRQLDWGLVQFGHFLGASKRIAVFEVIVPAVSPHIITGIRASLPLAFIGVTVGEFIAARQGLGLYVRESVSLLDTTGAFAGLVLFFLLIALMSSALRRWELYILRWLPRKEREGVQTRGLSSTLSTQGPDGVKTA